MSEHKAIATDVERYRAILDDTARWLEHWGEGDTPARVAETLRHWLDDPQDFDRFRGMAESYRELGARR
jgi:hypothetical protein